MSIETTMIRDHSRSSWSRPTDPRLVQARIGTTKESVPAPVVVLSHGTGGAGEDLDWLANTPNRRGFLVASVDHPGNNNNNNKYLVVGFSFGWVRARDNSLLLEHPEVEHRLDVDRIGAAGFSFGGCSRHDVGGKIDADIMAEVFHGLLPAPEVPKFPALIKTLLSKYSDAELTSFAETAGDSMADSRLRAGILPARALRLLLQLPPHPRPGKRVVGERPLAPFQQATSE